MRKHNRLLERYLRHIFYENTPRDEKQSAIKELLFNVKAKSALKKLHNNGISVRQFMREELGEECDHIKHFQLIFNSVNHNIIKATDIKYVMPVDNYLLGITQLYPSTEKLFSHPIYNHKNIDVDAVLEDTIGLVNSHKDELINDSKSLKETETNKNHSQEIKEYLSQNTQENSNLKNDNSDEMSR